MFIGSLQGHETEHSECTHEPLTRIAITMFSLRVVDSTSLSLGQCLLCVCGEFSGMMAQDDETGQHSTKQHQEPKVAGRWNILVSNDVAKKSQAGAGSAECEIKLLNG